MQPLPINVTLQLTQMCNLRCRMCYYWGEKGCYSQNIHDQKPAIMEYELVKSLIEELKPVKPYYSLFGGEPLTHPQLEDIILLIKQAGSVVDTPTNGTLLKEKASMLISTGFDNVRVSLDGPREINDKQRGKGSYDKAMEGMRTLHELKQQKNAKKPILSIIYTITPLNHLSIEQFFLQDIDVKMVDWISIQMQNFITEEMSNEYANMLKTLFNIETQDWKGIVQDPRDFSSMDYKELARQVSRVMEYYISKGKNVLLLPPTFSPRNLEAYNAGKWNGMVDLYRACPAPWKAVDITAEGDVAPCHVFYDLKLGNLHYNTFEEIWNSDKYKTFREYMKERGLMSICNIGCCILYLMGKKQRKSKQKGP